MTAAVLKLRDRPPVLVLVLVLVLVCVALLGACHYDAYLPPTQATFPVYAVQSLGVLAGGTQSQANAGTATIIVGWAADVGGAHHAVTFAGGNATRLAEPSGTVSSEANGVNASGVIVGFAILTSGVRQALLWSSATVAPIALSSLGGANTFARGINDANTVLGTAQDAAGDTTLVFWQFDGANYDVAPVDSTTGVGFTPAATNDAGEIAGNYDDDSAFFWDSNDGFLTAAPPSGTIHAAGLSAYGIEVGRIGNGSSPAQAYVFTGQIGVVVLGAPPSSYTDVAANSISSGGFIAGTASTVDGTGATLTSVGVISSVVNPTAAFAALPTLGGTRTQPSDNGMTACGVILGSATTASSTQLVAVAWIPKGCSVP